ncbi:ParA family protein [Deinococcus maricopensis]|nr:ParA family protein [Deinococcus maricopensis]
MSNKRSGPLIIGLASLKGGVGKTTSAVHIAAHLADRGLQVLLADGDRIRTASAWGRGGRLPFKVGSAAMLARAGDYDAVVIDSRGGPEDTELLDLAENSDQLILPTTPDLSGMDGMIQTIEVLDRHGIPADRYAALLTMIRPRSMKEALARKALTENNIPALKAGVRQSEAFRDANNAATLVRDVRGNDLAGKCWRDYGAVTTELLRRIGVDA